MTRNLMKDIRLVKIEEEILNTDICFESGKFILQTNIDNVEKESD